MGIIRLNVHFLMAKATTVLLRGTHIDGAYGYGVDIEGSDPTRAAFSRNSAGRKSDY